jgi:two-component system chemotaxis sensor kinase CheA
MSRDPLQYFRIEAREILDQLTQGVLSLEKHSGGKEQLALLLRLAHTLKGAARVVKQLEIADRAHALEDLLAPYRDSSAALPKECINNILEILDRLREVISALAAPPAEMPKDPRAAAPAAGPHLVPEIRTVRADIAEMDGLLDGITEAHTYLTSLRHGLKTIERVNSLADLLLDQLPGTSENGSSDMAGSRARATAEELRRLIGGTARSLSSGVDQLQRELSQARDSAERLRLIQAGNVFSLLERTARDAAQSQGKRVRFEARGAAVRLDAHVLESIQGALVQAVRNAVAHGIEPEYQRAAAGKLAEACVSLEVLLQNRNVIFRCRDDGRGIDLDAVKRKLQQRGSLAAGADPSVDEILALLLKGGVSTSATVTELSGRGVGLDVIRSTVETLGGTARLHTEAGNGTLLELQVPLFVAAVDVLLAEVAETTFGLPLEAVRACRRLEREELAVSADGEMLIHEGRSIPFVPLGRMLTNSFSTARISDHGTALIVETGGHRAAFGVDRLLGTRNIVLRPLPELAAANPVFSGASFDAEGDPQLVLSPAALLAGAQNLPPPSAAVEEARVKILVIDDSLTTRMLEQSILESAGYDVDLAKSGEEGLEKAAERKYALFLVDVEMPGIDGFTFVERTKQDPSLKDIPAILVTSRCAPEDIQRGEHVGAKGYIVKGEFDQRRLLELIRKLTEEI